MAKTRNLLVHVKIETAVASRRCHTSSAHEIGPGQQHLAVHTGSGRENVCHRCASKVLNRAEEYVAELRRELGLP